MFRNLTMRIRLTYLKWAWEELFGRDPAHEDLPELFTAIEDLKLHSRPVDIHDIITCLILGTLIGLCAFMVWTEAQAAQTECSTAPAPRADELPTLWGDLSYGESYEQCKRGADQAPHPAGSSSTARSPAEPRRPHGQGHHVFVHHQQPQGWHEALQDVWQGGPERLRPRVI